MSESKENYDNYSDDGWSRDFNVNTHKLKSNDTASKQSGDDYEVNLRNVRRTDYKNKAILNNVGQVASWYGEFEVDENGNKYKPLRTGTGTVFRKLQNGYYSVVTCAHNLSAHSPSNNTLSHPKDVYFFAKGMKTPNNRMKCVKSEIYHEYDASKQQCPNDLAVALFHDDKGVSSAYYKDINVDESVSLDEWTNAHHDRFDLWGYPVASKGLLQGENGEAMQTETGFWQYDIATYPGQSGAALFQRRKEKKNVFCICGIHVWGDVEKQENNCGVFLDKKKIGWIQSVSDKFDKIAQNAIAKKKSGGGAATKRQETIGALNAPRYIIKDITVSSATIEFDQTQYQNHGKVEYAVEIGNNDGFEFEDDEKKSECYQLSVFKNISTYLCENLDFGTIYKVRTRCKNKYGWSPYSNVVSFETKQAERECFEFPGRYIAIKENGKRMEVIADTGWNSTTYGALTIPPTKQCVIEWQMKVCKGGYMILGITSCHDDNDKRFATNKISNNYAFGCYGYKYSKGKATQYGEQCKEGDIVCMRLNLISKELSFCVKNGKDFGVAFSDIVVSENIKYKMAVSLYYTASVVTLVDVQCK